MAQLKLRILYLVYCWSASMAAGPTYYKETLLEAPALTAEQISVYVHSNIPGNLTWRFVDADNLGISVTAITNTVQEIGHTQIDLQSNSSHVNLYIGAKQQTTVAATGSGSRPLYSDVYAILVIWMAAVVHHWRHPGLGLLIILANGVCRGLADDKGYGIPSNRKRVSIELRVPRRYKFSDVYLLVNGGMIRVDVTSGPGDVSNFTCSTGVDPVKVCSGCCYGNGYCSNNTCVCEDDYDPQTYCKSKKRKDTFYSHPLDPRLVESMLPSGDTVLIQEPVNGDSVYNGGQRAKHYKPYTDAIANRHVHMTLFSDTHSNPIDVIFDPRGAISEIRKREDRGYPIRFVQKCDKSDASVNATVEVNSDVITIGTCTENARKPVEETEADTTTNDGVGNKTGNATPLRHTRRERKRKPRRRKTRKRKKARNSSVIDLPITVHRCGGDISVDHVTIKLTPFKNNSSSVTLTATPDTSNDKFILRLPNVSVPVPDSVFSKKCKHVIDRSVGVCSDANMHVLELGCRRLSQWNSRAFARDSHVTHGNTTTAVNICSYVYNTIRAFCDIFIKKPTNADNETCYSIFSETINIFQYDSFYLYPKVLFTDGKVIVGPKQNVSMKSLTTVRNEILIEDDKPLFTIKSLSVLPKDPVPQDIYQVILKYECATGQTIVYMNVTGSDLYRNHATCHGVTACQCCILHVAGATDAVIDHVTIHAIDPSTNTNISKDMIVTF